MWKSGQSAEDYLDCSRDYIEARAITIPASNAGDDCELRLITHAPTVPDKTTVSLLLRYLSKWIEFDVNHELPYCKD